MSKTTAEELARSRSGWSKTFRELNPSLVAGAPAAPPTAPQPRPQSPLAAKFEALWAAAGGPELTPEFRFHKTRKWRFDYAIPELFIAIELEGGIHKRVGHASPEGYIKDCWKYNEAALAGYTVFRLASGMMQPEPVAAIAAHCRAKAILKDSACKH